MQKKYFEIFLFENTTKNTGLGNLFLQCGTSVIYQTLFNPSEQKVQVY